MGCFVTDYVGTPLINPAGAIRARFDSKKRAKLRKTPSFHNFRPLAHGRFDLKRPCAHGLSKKKVG
jgi:hypothetical protein